MSNKKRGALSLIAAMVSMSGPNIMDIRKPVLELPPEDFEEPYPGQKTYFFNAGGEFNNNKMLRTECVFKCFAINDKNAERKFLKFKQSQNV